MIYLVKKLKIFVFMFVFPLLVGSALYAQSDTDETSSFIEKWENYIKENPERDKGYVELGKFFDYQGQSEKAIEYFDKALEKSPNKADTLWRKADSLRSLGKEEQAINLAERLIEKFPKDWGAYVVLGRIYSERFYAFRDGPFDQRKKYLEKALWHLHKAVELDRDNKWANNLLGILYHHQARYVAKDEAEKAYFIMSSIKFYKKALESPPIDTYDNFDNSIQCNLGYIYYKHLKDYGKGLDCYQQALEIDPDSEVAIFFVKRIKELMKQTTN